MDKKFRKESQNEVCRKKFIFSFTQKSWLDFKKISKGKNIGVILIKKICYFLDF